MKVLAVGDIHTKLWIIESVVSMIEKYDKIVFVGDYADDFGASAQDSINTWAALKELQEKYPEKVVLVTGNHDYIYVNKTPTLQSGYNNITQLMINMPENKELRDWLKALPIQVYIDDVTYTHAGVDANWNTSEDPKFVWTDHSPIWNRPGYTVYGPEAQVFGHTPSETCWEVEPNIWCIDTFSTYPNGDPFGDFSVLEIVDGKTFIKKELS